MSHRTVETNGTRLHLAEAGSGPPILLLHGWPQHWWSWRHLIGPLAEDHHVLVPDLRGWGWSEAPAGDYAKSTFAADIIGLLDAEEIERADVIGHDWGGFTAFLMALERPERVNRLVALDIVPPWRGRAPRPDLLIPPMLAYQSVLAAPLIGPRTMTSGTRFIRTIIRRGSGAGMRWSEDELDIYAEVLREGARARASSACYRTFLVRELPAMLRGRYRAAQLQTPTLLIMGGQSFLRHGLDPRSDRVLELETVQASGHFLPEEAPAQVLELATSFLRAGGSGGVSAPSRG